MAIVSKKTFLNTNQKNQQKAASTQQSGIANRADFVAGASGGNSEMQRRKMAYENYKKAVEAQRQAQAANAQRQQLLAGEARTDAMRDAAQAYSQSGYGKAAQQAAYENYIYALKQQELRQKQMRGQVLTPAEQKILNTNVYKDVGAAEAAERSKTRNENVQRAQERTQKRKEQISEQEFNRSSAMQEIWGSYSNYVRGVYAGYDEAVAKREAEQAKTSEDLQAESDALQTQIDELSDKLKTAYQNPSSDN